VGNILTSYGPVDFSRTLLYGANQLLWLHSVTVNLRTEKHA